MSGFHYVVHEVAILVCPRCKAFHLRANQRATSHGHTDINCSAMECDADLRRRITQGGMIGMKDARFQRMPCAGKMVVVPNHEAALATLKVGGLDAVAAMLEEEDGEPKA